MAIRRLLHPISRVIGSGKFFTAAILSSKMGGENLSLIPKRKHAQFRVANVSGFKTDILEIHSEEPALHVLFVPGNPGVVAFYTDFLESIYELFEGTASVTGISYISHSEKNWEAGRLFSLDEQIDHKKNFIEQEFQDVKVPIILVGHSIGSYVCLQIFKQHQNKVRYCICLYPFLTLNTASTTQASISRLVRSPALGATLSYIGAVLGMLPGPVSRFLVKNSVGKFWSPSAVENLRTHFLKYHTIRNMIFMANTEFQKLTEKPEFDFIMEKKNQIAFLFGLDDHWGPLHLYEEICREVPGACVEVERNGHPHAFSCTEAGSLLVAQRLSFFIKNFLENPKTT